MGWLPRQVPEAETDFGWLLKIHTEVDGSSKQKKSKRNKPVWWVPGEKGEEKSLGHLKMDLNSSFSLNLEIVEGIKHKLILQFSDTANI